MKLNKKLLYQILESCEKHLPEESENRGWETHDFPKEDFDSMQPYNGLELDFHFKLLSQIGYIDTNNKLILGLTLMGYENLEKMRKEPTNATWLFM